MKMTYICFTNIGCGPAKANQKNCVFHLLLHSPFAIFADVDIIN